MTLTEVDIKCAAFDPAGKTLAIGLESGEVKLCSWPALEVTKSLGKHGDSVTGIAFSPDGKFILTTSSEPANKPDKAGRGDGAVHSDHNYIVYRYTKPQRAHSLHSHHILRAAFSSVCLTVRHR